MGGWQKKAEEDDRPNSKQSKEKEETAKAGKEKQQKKIEQDQKETRAKRDLQQEKSIWAVNNTSCRHKCQQVRSKVLRK